MPARDPHAIRIVPVKTFELKTPGKVHPRPGGRLTYRDGPLLTAVDIHTIFWGAAWQGAQAGLIGQINSFFQFVVTSPLIDQLAEYSVPGFAIGHGTFAGTTTIATSEPGPSISDTEIQAFLTTDPAAKTAFDPASQQPPQVSNRLVFLYLPPGTVVAMGGSASCTNFCGYHSEIEGQKFYAVMPFPGCGGCNGGLSTLDALTSTSSHELCESITDPLPGSGWYDDQYGEIGDLCAWQTKTLGTYTVQKEWSNAASSCR